MNAPIIDSAAAFRRALGCFTTGITVVTTCDARGADVGLTANSFNSVSLDPPLVLWSLARSSLSLDAFRTHGHFAVHILAADQEALSSRFARRGNDKFAGLGLQRGAGGVPLLQDCSARFQCRTAFQYEGGDHVIFVGEVLAFDHSARVPLVYHDGSYGMVLKRPAAAAAAPAVSPPPADSGFSGNFLGYLLGRAYHQLLRPLRAPLQHLELSESEYYVLSILGVGLPCHRDEIDALIELTGIRFTDVMIARLRARGLIEAAGDGVLLRITSAGLDMLLQMMTVAKAAEASALQDVSHADTQQLRRLLKRLITQTDPGLPTLMPAMRVPSSRRDDSAAAPARAPADARAQR